jgi:hypothetical protein
MDCKLLYSQGFLQMNWLPERTLTSYAFKRHLEASCFGVSIAAPSYTTSSWAVGCFDVYMGFLNNPIYHDMVIFLYDAHIPMPRSGFHSLFRSSMLT